MGCLSGSLGAGLGFRLVRFVWLGLVAALAPWAAAQAAARPVVTVAADGSGQYKTVQAAVDATPQQGIVIRIAPGTYKEKIHIVQDGVQLRGMGSTPDQVVLTWDDSAGSAGGTNKSASLSVTGDDFYAENLTVQNDFEKTHSRTERGSQAVALMITGDREVLRHVRLLGYQDTLYANSKTCHGSADPTDKPCRASRQLFEDCYIAGHVDYIFGDAKAAFVRCELHAMAHPVITITAQSKLYPLEDSGYLFRDCTITSDKGVDSLLLGRPWRPYSTVYFIDTKVNGMKVAAAGWSEWAGKLATSTYGEYNTGPKDDTSQRIAPSRQLTKAEADKLTVAAWLSGPDGWNAEEVR
jgi:pectinesterase